MTIVLIAGPPCAGKTTYAQQHTQPGDVVLDQDDLGHTAMQRQLARLGAVKGTAWVIRCAPGPTRRQALAQQLGAERVVLLVPPTHVLMTRARSRPSPARHVRAIEKWLADEAADPPPGRAGQAHDPDPGQPPTRW